MKHLSGALKIMAAFALMVIVVIIVSFTCYYIQETFGLVWTLIPLSIFVFGVSYVVAWLGDIK